MEKIKIAIIENNIVKNVVVADSSFADSLEALTVDITNLPEVEKGWIYENENFVDPFTKLSLEEQNEIKSNQERKWRDRELNNSDWIVPLTDYPQHADYLTYRQELRDYPAQADFPSGDRPIKP